MKTTPNLRLPRSKQLRPQVKLLAKTSKSKRLALLSQCMWEPHFTTRGCSLMDAPVTRKPWLSYSGLTKAPKVARFSSLSTQDSLPTEMDLDLSTKISKQASIKSISKSTRARSMSSISQQEYMHHEIWESSMTMMRTWKRFSSLKRWLLKSHLSTTI